MSERVIRDQFNFLDVPFEGGTVFDPKEDRTRQEFKKEADVNYLLKKYGGGLPLGGVQYGEQNMDLDLMAAHDLVRRLDGAYSSLPAAVRAKYPNIYTLIAAVEAGSFVDPAESSNEAPKAVEGQ